MTRAEWDKEAEQKLSVMDELAPADKKETKAEKFINACNRLHTCIGCPFDYPTPRRGAQCVRDSFIVDGYLSEAKDGT